MWPAFAPSLTPTYWNLGECPDLDDHYQRMTVTGLLTKLPATGLLEESWIAPRIAMLPTSVGLSFRR